MLASTMQFSKFGQFPFEPAPAKYSWRFAEKGPRRSVARIFRTQQCVMCLRIPLTNVPLRKRLY